MLMKTTTAVEKTTFLLRIVLGGKTTIIVYWLGVHVFGH